MGPALAYGPSASSPSLSQLSEGPKAAPSAVETGRVQLAFALVKEIAIAPGYLLIRNDSGRARPYPNCEASGKCENGTIEALLSRFGTGTVVLNCRDVGGCAIVGGR
jgi:hypothetical protein